MEPRNKHGWLFWFAVTVVALPVLYVGSFGPVLWFTSRADRGADIVSRAYQPLLKFSREDRLASKACYRYAKFGAAKDWIVGLDYIIPDDTADLVLVCEWRRREKKGLWQVIKD